MPGRPVAGIRPVGAGIVAARPFVHIGSRIAVRRPLVASPDDIEAQFYEALQQADIAKLMGVWSDDDEIVCVLPGGSRMVGRLNTDFS